ncbi:MAG TPA: HD domain-containing phosphohydrolase [Gaiellaceae bacterium]|nr:HD domain-containing phosphohydrolase [Gaiellaceae bacterium]
MPARLRLPLCLAACLLGTVALALGLWRQAQADVRSDARAQAVAAARAIEHRADAAVLSLHGLRAAYDTAPPTGQEAFSNFARAPLERPELVAIGWAPRVAAAGRSALEAAEQIRIAAPADTLFTYPLIVSSPPRADGDVVDLGTDPSLGRALRAARTAAEPRLSAPVRLPGDGRLGVYAFVPVFRPGTATGSPAERRDGLRGLVVGAVATGILVDQALAESDVRVTDGPSVLSGAAADEAEIARAHVFGRTWRVAVPLGSASPVAPLAVAGAGLGLILLLLVFSRALGSLSKDVRALHTALVGLRARSTRELKLAAARVHESEQAVQLLAAAGEAAVLDVDRDGIIRSCSGAVAALLGYRDDELTGTAVYALLHPNDLLAPPSGPQRYVRSDGTYTVLETRRLTRRDPLGFASGVVTVLRTPVPLASVRTYEQRLADAVALEPDPVELFSVVAEETALELGLTTAAIVRFESESFGSIVGAWQARGASGAVPGSTIDLDPMAPAGIVFRSGSAAGAAPLRVGARLWGALLAEGGDDVRLAKLAEAAQGTIAFADASSRLSALATRDALTNLPDHRAFQEQLRAEVRRAQRHERALSLVLVNLDGFRQINDEHGRLAGDRVLGEAARRLGAAVRQGEIVSRVGGDHFAWILPETEGLNGWIGAERARRAISSVAFDGIGTVTASSGVCDLEDVGSPEELLALAEVALVHAKSSGGDATFRYSQELDGSDGVALTSEEHRPLARLRALAQELDAEDPGTEGHSERVSRVAEKLALSAGWRADQAVRLAQAAFVHDVGKLSVGEDVLSKTGPLTDEELEQMRNHPDTGAEIAVNALDHEQISWIRHHHERWDGAGYPNGLAGDLIPAGARLLALAEAWDSMTSTRLYGEARTTGAALAECRRESGGQFAPEAIAALDRLWTLGALSIDAPVLSAD